MKVSKTVRAAIGAMAISLFPAIHTLAIENLQLSVQSSNVLLSWPSATNETFIIQSLQALQSTDAWLTLTDGFPAAVNTNLTVFVETNGVQPTIWITNASGGTNGGGIIPPGGGGTNGGVFGYATGFYRVVRDGVHVFGLTNGEVLSGTIQQPIEFAVASTDEIIGLSFYDTNSNPIVGAWAAPGPGGGWTFNWNTSMETNGNYAMIAELDFGTDAPVASLPLTVTVSNLISFPNYLAEDFGGQMWIYAQTIPNADVEIDMYDENTNYLGSFLPISDTNGVISFNWGLTDGNGNPLSDTNYMGYWTLFLPSSGGSPARTGAISGRPTFVPFTQKMRLIKLPPSELSRPNFVRHANLVTTRGPVSAGASPGGGIYNTNASSWWNYEMPWTPNNNWIVAAGDFADPIVAPDADQVEDDLVYGEVGDNEGAYLFLRSHGANIGPPGNSSADPGLFVVNNATTRNTLMSYLASKNPYYSNLFWFGHGNAVQLGTADQGTAMSQAQIGFALDNVPLNVQSAHIAGHPYRFVWAEGCDTAEGTLCEAFACPPKLLSTNDFIRLQIWSRVFLGYTTEFHPDLNQNGNWHTESEIIYIMLQNFLSGTYNLNTLVPDAHNDAGPFYGLDYWLRDPTGIFGAGDLLYPSPW